MINPGNTPAQEVRWIGWQVVKEDLKKSFLSIYLICH
jgi:hypothetical protein